MKRTHMLVLSVLAFGLQGIAQAAPFPADAEASYDLPALETYMERHARAGDGSAAWGVGKRLSHDSFPVGVGFIADD